MTVTTTNAASGPYTPNGVTTAFAFTFAALSASEVKVVRRSSLNVDTVLTGYTVTLSSPGGTVTFAVAPAAGDPIYILSDPAFTQQVTFSDQGSFSPASLNGALDRAAIRDIRLAYQISLLTAGAAGSAVWGGITGTLANQSDLSTALAAKENSLGTSTVGFYLAGDKTWAALNKGAVGLGNADNTSDANKPVSIATQAALNAKPSLTGATFTGAIYATNLAGTNTGDQTITLTGDVTGSGSGSFVTAIGANKVGLSQMTPIAGNSLLGNNTSASANPLVLPVATVAGMLPTFSTTANGVTPLSPGTSTSFLAADGVWRVPSTAVGSVAWGAITGTLANQTDLNTALAAKAALTGATFTGSISATNLSGTNTGDQTITLTGDVTGSGTGSFAATIGANKVTFAKFVAASAASLVGASAAGNFAELTPATARSVLGLATVATSASASDLTSGTLAVARGGTGVGTSTGTGSVVLSASPALTGAPTAPTAAIGDSSTTLATTAFVATANLPVIQSVASAATVTPTFANDQVNITAQAVGLTLANPTGTAVDGWGIVIRIKDNGTARTIAYGTQYRAIGITLPTTTVVGKALYLGMIFNNADTTWDVLSVMQQA